MSGVTVHHGDSREVLKSIPDASVDSVVTDPPYALVSIVKRFGAEGAAAAKSDGASGVYARASAGFMGQRWDTGETAFDPVFWAEVLRVLKPGGHVVAASGTRTYHRLACAVEDAGFEIRDMVSWLYGSGFPKNHAVPPLCILETGQEIDGHGTALKPACEPWVLARKPLAGTVLENVLAHGTGALNIDGCRVGYDMADTNPATNPLHRKRAGYANGNASDENSTSFALKDGSGERNPNDQGRWPANVVHDDSDEVVGAFPEAPGQQRAVTGEERSYRTVNAYGDFGSSRTGAKPHGDAGSAARFFYSAKADATDRHGSAHPTVKPVDLMRWLCRLITPPGGVVLDPFAGSGSTGIAALREGFSAILVEREQEYVADIQRRLAWERGEGGLTVQERVGRKLRPEKARGDDTPLFNTPSTPTHKAAA